MGGEGVDGELPSEAPGQQIGVTTDKGGANRASHIRGSRPLRTGFRVGPTPRQLRPVRATCRACHPGPQAYRKGPQDGRVKMFVGKLALPQTATKLRAGVDIVNGISGEDWYGG